MKVSATLKKVLCIALGIFALQGTTHAQYNSFLNDFSRYAKKKAEGKSVKSYLRYSFYYGIGWSSGTFTDDFTAIDGSGNTLGDQSVSRDFNMKGICAGVNTYFPLYTVSNNGAVVFNLDINEHAFLQDMGVVHTGTVMNYSYSLKAMMLCVPLSIAYKYGGEAIYDKAQRVSFTIGAGLSPTLYATQFGPIQQAKFGIRPYAHAELGLFAGIEWKIKLSYFPGNARVMDLGPDAAPYQYNGHVQIHTGSVFSVGIAIMPFSFGWDDSRW